MVDVPGNSSTTVGFEGVFAGNGSPVDASYSGVLETWGDVDFISVFLSAGVQYRFEITGTTDAGTFGIRYIRPNGETSGFSGNGAITLTPTAAEAGQYYIAVFSNGSSLLEYSVPVHSGTVAARYGSPEDDVITAASATIFGGLGNDRLTLTVGGKLFGDAGNDVLVAGVTEDQLFGGSGNDTLSGGSESDRLEGGDGNDVLSGGADDDVLLGGIGNDVLNGGAGADRMAGEDGNDTYYVADTSDTVSEYFASGNDVVVSSITFSLANAASSIGDVERLTLTGNAVIHGTGNALANIVIGNAAANILSGGAGNDTLSGGAGTDSLFGALGIDVLAGGAGNDLFVFNTAPNAATNRDTITDFANGTGNNDSFRLENAVFTKLGDAGLLLPAFFRAGASAADANDFIVYNRATGALFYDANGSAAGGAVQLAILSNKPLLTSADFVVF